MVENSYKIIEIPLPELLPTAMAKRAGEWRIAQICSVYLDGKYELSYSFAREYDVEHYRIVIDKEETVPSITPVYKSAFLYENEMKELFGVNIEHIGVMGILGTDYKNKLYRINEETPFIKEDK